ncbi:nitrate reductase molybdenum cofactor assembly chaperone (plasmid) [Embleya sp. NBC_00888]|uniref:nitrate reductase molybdenum cofactor assembly chaperone n=1 Tax=Embleya sp. NBC_00888 TaxID=2975960 RepID=UPI002F909D51|nr:nitrate reductase molybdenum cofactor assembly chaperone [Embleya sp. NBC_00888]
MKSLTDRFRAKAARFDDRYSTAVIRQAAALCLHHPDEIFHSRVPLVRGALAQIGPRPAGTLLTAFLDGVCAWPAAELAAHHVSVFDQRSLYLSRWREEDTRWRGEALVTFKRIYREHGLEFTGEELPDFLPAVLEFAAIGGPGPVAAGEALLREHRPGIELLRFALLDAGTPYAGVLEAVCTTLPGASPADRALAHAGPPRKDVGPDGTRAGGVER